MSAIKFLGASVSDFNVNVSFGLQPSELTITLAEDPKDGDRFNPPPVGEPLLFTAQNFAFGGFLQSYTERVSTDGRIFEVKIVDPREFLSGVILILKNYTGSTGGINNLFNVYGYQFSQNPASIQDAGLTWREVLAAFSALSGGILRYRHYSFLLNLEGLPALPSYYRIGGDSISLLDFVADICDAASLDFYVDFDGTTIRISPFSRISQPQPGLIKRFIDSIEGASSKEVGQELRLDTVNRFVLGGKVRTFHYQFSNFYATEVEGGKMIVPGYNTVEDNGTIIGVGSQAQINAIRRQKIAEGVKPNMLTQTGSGGLITLRLKKFAPHDRSNVADKPSSTQFTTDHNIWPYWGEDVDGNLIIGEGFNDDHQFTMNIAELGVTFNGVEQVGYLTDVAEIRTAGESREAWEAFLCANSTTRFKINPFGGSVGFVYETDFTDDDILVSTIRRNKMASELRHPYDGLLSFKPLKPVIRQDIKRDWESFKENAYKDTTRPQLGFKDNKTLEQLVETYYQENVASLQATEVYVTYRHNNEYNIHYGKIFFLDIDEVLSTSFLGGLLDGSVPADKMQFGQMAYKPKEKKSHKAEREFAVERLFNRLADMFNNYYGKKFMVRIPFNVSRIDGDITKINTTLVPTDSAPVDESVVDSAISNNVLPEYYAKFITEDGKIESYVRADLFLKKVADPEEKNFNENTDEYSFVRLDASVLNPEDYVYNANGSSVFVRCSVDPTIRFINRSVLFGPRAIIELPNQLVYNEDDLLGSGHEGQMKKLIQAVLGVRQTNGETVPNIDDVIAGFGSEVLFHGRKKLFAYPVLAAIPLESQVSRYGPFYNLNMPGKVELDIDDNLTPWTYGSYENMAGAGYAKIIDSLSGQYASETGSVTVPGLPTILPGHRLIGGGPNITGITCNVTDGGIFTTYKMSSWTNKFGRLAKQYADAIEKSVKDIHQVKSVIGKRIKEGDTRRRNYSELEVGRPARQKPNSSHMILGAEMRDGRYEVTTMPHYHFNQQAGDTNYNNRAFMSLDGLFVPVSFGSGHTGDLPKYPYLSKDEELGIQGGHCNNLNPYFYGDKTGVGTIAVGESADECNKINTHGLDVRGIALKSPLILAGWGFNTSGLPEPGKLNTYDGPGASGINEMTFADDYRTDTSLWKVGPLDARWDDARKVWAVGGAGVVRLAYAHRASRPNTYTKFELIKTLDYARIRLSGDAAGAIEDFKDGAVDVFNPFASLPSGAVAVIGRDDSDEAGWLIISAWGQV